MTDFFDDRPEDGEQPDESTEEYLLGGIDKEIRPEPEPRPPASEPTASEPPAQEPPAEEPPAQEPPAAAEPPPPPAEPPAAGEPPAADPAAPQPGQPGEYVEQGTEEIFALDAQRILDGEDVPELDPILRAALLEGSEAEVSSANTGEEPLTGDNWHDGPETSESALPAGPDTGTHESGPYDTGTQDTGTYDTGTQEWEAPSEADLTAEHTMELTALAKSEVHEAIATSRKTGEPWSPSRPPTGGDFEEPPKRQRYWWRFMLATVIIIFSFAGATSAAIIGAVDDIANDIGHDSIISKLPPKLLRNTDGGPETIAILGSDARTGGGDVAGDPGRSDTTLLLRLDPDTGQIALMSIPRDLKVDIPGYGTDKFNAAYSYGGPELTLKTIKSVTGLDINHVVNIDFQGFAEAIDAIGCVFIDVDRHYYHSNVGLSAAEQYAEIDIDAGYQKLCGPDALEYARYRHTDTDLARAARQQGLLAQVRSRLSFGEVFKRRTELIHAFTHNTESDIDTSDQIFDILGLLFDSKDDNVTNIEFPATLGPSYVTATPEEIQGAVDKFLGFEDTPGPTGSLSNEPKGANSKKADKKKTDAARKQRAKDNQAAQTGESGDLVDASQGGLDVAVGLKKEIKRHDFDVWYPKMLPPGTIYAEGSRTYHIRDPDKNAHGAYRMVMDLQLSDGDHYFGLQGIYGWEDPPILDAPHDDVTKDGRDFKVFHEGDRISLVSWTDNGNLYWISNSILQTLTNNQMMGIARSTKAFTPDKKK